MGSMTAAKSKTEKVDPQKTSECEKENKTSETKKPKQGAGDWADFEEQEVPLKALVPLASEVTEMPHVETKVVGGGASDGFDRSGPPGRGGYDRQDRRGRPPYERRNDYGDQPKRRQYDDQRQGPPRDNSGRDYPPRDDYGRDRAPRGDYGRDQPPRGDYGRDLRGGDRYGDRPPARNGGYGGDQPPRGDYGRDTRGGDRYGERPPARNDGYGGDRGGDFGRNQQPRSDYGRDSRGGDQYGERPPMRSGGYGGDRGGPRPPNPPSKSLRIFGVPYSCTEDEFKDWYNSNSGGMPYTNLNFVKDRATGDFRGFCFINFETIEDATTAKEKLFNTEIQAR